LTRAGELTDEEAARIGCGEAQVVGKARVPAFGHGPTHGYRNFIRSHGSDVQADHGG